MNDYELCNKARVDRPLDEWNEIMVNCSFTNSMR